MFQLDYFSDDIDKEKYLNERKRLKHFTSNAEIENFSDLRKQGPLELYRSFSNLNWRVVFQTPSYFQAFSNCSYVRKKFFETKTFKKFLARKSTGRQVGL